MSEFEEIYRANIGPITGFFARRSGDPQVVADLSVDTFVEAITSFGTFDPAKGVARAWLFGIARRVYARHCDRCANSQSAVRQLAGRRELDVDEVEDLVRRIDAEQPGRHLLRRWARLPPADRLAVELVDIVGLTPKEAAVAVGLYRSVCPWYRPRRPPPSTEVHGAEPRTVPRAKPRRGTGRVPTS